MSARHDIAWSQRLAGNFAGQLLLWTTAAAFALAAHAGAAWWLMRQPPALPADPGEPTAIMIELAPVPMAPAAEAEQIAPDEADSVAAEAPPPPETAEPAERVQTTMLAEPVPPEEEAVPDPERAEAVEVEPAEPVETEDVAEVESDKAEPVTVEKVTQVEPETAEPVTAEEVTQAEPKATEPAAPEEVTQVEPETIEPDEVDPVEEIVAAAFARDDVPVPTARPDPPPPPPARTEQPRQQRQQITRLRQQQAAPSREAARAQVQAQEAPRAAAPQTSRGAATVSPARWQSRLLAHLERRKRYPADARRQRQQGTAQVRFTIDAGGNVQSVSLVSSSGVAALDQEVVAMVRRASPVPAPPPGINRTIVVPVRFSLR